jgi:hypothetical protein
VKAKRGYRLGRPLVRVAGSSPSRGDLVFEFLSSFPPFHWPTDVANETLPSSKNRALKDLVCRVWTNEGGMSVARPRQDEKTRFLVLGPAGARASRKHALIPANGHSILGSPTPDAYHLPQGSASELSVCSPG